MEKFDITKLFGSISESLGRSLYDFFCDSLSPELQYKFGKAVYDCLSDPDSSTSHVVRTLFSIDSVNLAALEEFLKALNLAKRANDV